MKSPNLRSEIREIALAVLEAHGDDPEVSRQVEALVGSVDDTLPNEVILEELKELQAGGQRSGRLLQTTRRGSKIRKPGNDIDSALYGSRNSGSTQILPTIGPAKWPLVRVA